MELGPWDGDELFGEPDESDADESATPGEPLLYALGQVHRLSRRRRMNVRPDTLEVADVASILGIGKDIEFVSEDRPRRPTGGVTEIRAKQQRAGIPGRLRSDAGMGRTTRQAATLPIMLPARDLADLVRLRHTLMHSGRLAADLSEWGRHTALVALDGACEYAMRLSLARLDAGQQQNAKFPNLINTLDTQLGSRWSPPGRRDILDMRNARNGAQHGGVLPDPALMPVWHDAVDVFIRSLVDAVYGVDLDDVLLADAVREPHLRADMAAIEQQLADGDHTRAFHAAVELLERARSRWRDQQEDAYGWMPSPGASDALPDLLDATDRGNDYADVGVFADDLGEYHWLLATRRQASNGLEVTEDDARRAALFVYHWLLRWQHFDARYPRDRWRAAYAELTPPSTFDEEGEQQPTRITELSFTGRMELSGTYWRKVLAVIANIPAGGRGDWGTDMPGALAAAAQQHGLAASENAAHGDVIASAAEPVRGRFTFLVAPSFDAETVVELLTDTVQQASAQYQERQRTAAELSSRVAEITDALATAFDDDRLGLFGPLSVRSDVRRTGEVFVVRIPVDGTHDELMHAVQTFSNVGRTLAGAMLEDGEILVAASEDEAAQRADLQTAVGRCTAHVQRVRRELAALDAADREFASALEAAVARTSP